MKVLIIEDEASLLRGMLEYFRKEEFMCEGVDNFNEGLTRLEDFDYDCIILDINLPGGSGLELLKYLRQQQKEDGVIILSARDSLDDKITGLNLGADDYITKPFHLPELNARIKSLLRRKHSRGNNVLQFGTLSIEMQTRTVLVDNEVLTLTKIEYDLLLFMVVNGNKVLSKRSIGEHLFGQESEDFSSFDFVYSHIKNLKRKLKEKGAEDIIQTVYGLGYKITV
ncbi:MAG TPA: response regulator transcription factor [Chitinophagaceae bacterium]|jgi:DNA-binding response OmpR family regulator|nr:response regulator transcription factor [Chitinophagaceae bacterium]